MPLKKDSKSVDKINQVLARNESLVRDLVAHALVTKKARDIRALDVSKLIAYTDFFVICSGQSEQHVRALSRKILSWCESHDIDPLSVEGTRFNRWILIDLGSIMIHIFLDSLRGVYELERLWVEARELELDLPSQTLFWDEDDLEAADWETEDLDIHPEGYVADDEELAQNGEEQEAEHSEPGAEKADREESTEK